jgi:hypothetical protein
MERERQERENKKEQQFCRGGVIFSGFLNRGCQLLMLSYRKPAGRTTKEFQYKIESKSACLFSSYKTHHTNPLLFLIVSKTVRLAEEN